MPATASPSAAHLGARLRSADPKAARELLRLLEATGSRERAAEALGCGVATVYRWLRLDVTRREMARQAEISQD